MPVIWKVLPKFKVGYGVSPLCTHKHHLIKYTWRKGSKLSRSKIQWPSHFSRLRFFSPILSHSVQGCDKPTKTQRYRMVLRRPALGSGVKCPHVVESELWDLGVNFFKVSWQWSDWGACVLDPGVPCGGGQRTRQRQCLRTDGEPTMEENCRKVGCCSRCCLRFNDI